MHFDGWILIGWTKAASKWEAMICLLLWISPRAVLVNHVPVILIRVRYMIMSHHETYCLYISKYKSVGTTIIYTSF